MSVTDPVVLEYSERHDYYFLTRGPETFYDDDRYIRVWSTPEEAIIWCEESLDCTPEVYRHSETSMRKGHNE